MENNTIVESYANVIKRVSKEMNISEEEVLEMTLKCLKEEITKKLNPKETELSNISRTDLEHYNLGMKKQLREKDKQIKELIEEIQKIKKN